MRAAILAAGHGERLAAAGFAMPKPLVPVAGRPLIDYVLAGVAEAGIRRVACIVNEQSTAVAEHCRAAWPDLHFEFVVRTTPSSMESLFHLAPLMGEERFVALTADTVAPPATLAQFIAAARARRAAEVVLAVTRFVDDEKPLWVDVGAAGEVRALGDAVGPRVQVTAGHYVFDPIVFREVEAARRGGFTALRGFLGHLLAQGYRVEADEVGPAVDVDRPEDLAVAEAFIARDYR